MLLYNEGGVVFIDFQSPITHGNLVLARVNGDMLIRRVSLHEDLYKIICPYTRNTLNVSVEIIGVITEVRFTV